MELVGRVAFFSLVAIAGYLVPFNLGWGLWGIALIGFPVNLWCLRQLYRG